MKLISFIENPRVIHAILMHLALWDVPRARPPPVAADGIVDFEYVSCRDRDFPATGAGGGLSSRGTLSCVVALQATAEHFCHNIVVFIDQRAGSRCLRIKFNVRVNLGSEASPVGCKLNSSIEANLIRCRIITLEIIFYSYQINLPQALTSDSFTPDLGSSSGVGKQIRLIDHINRLAVNPYTAHHGRQGADSRCDFGHHQDCISAP